MRLKGIFHFVASSAIMLWALACQDSGSLSNVNSQGELVLRWVTAPSQGVDSGSKSAFAPDEDALSSLYLYIYKEGKLDKEVDVSAEELSRGEISLSLDVGQVYDVYALANAPSIHAPADESGMELLCVGAESAAALESGVVPMAGRCMGVRASGKGGHAAGVCELLLERLAGRLDFVIDRSSLDGVSIDVRSVRIRQSAADVRPFASFSEAQSVYDGDYASEEDVMRLNAGGKVSFYMLENARGVLLPGNVDHWAKVPASIPSESALCTYLEVCAVYRAPGILGENLTYRLYLGEDNCSDFTVGRNKVNTLTLIPTGEGAFRSSWKVEMGEYEDSRQLHFLMHEIDICAPVNSEAFLAVFTDPQGLRWDISFDGDAASNAGLRIAKSASGVSLLCDYRGDGELCVPLYLTASDGSVKDSCMVRVSYKDPSSTGVEFHWAQSGGRLVSAQTDRLRFDVMGALNLEDFHSVEVRATSSCVKVSRSGNVLTVSALRPCLCEIVLSLDGLEFTTAVEVRNPVMRLDRPMLRVPVDGSSLPFRLRYLDPYTLDSAAEGMYAREYDFYDAELAGELLSDAVLDTPELHFFSVHGKMMDVEEPSLESRASMRLDGYYDPLWDETLDSMFGDFSDGDMDCGVFTVRNTALGISCSVPLSVAYPFAEVRDLGPFDCYGMCGSDDFSTVLNLPLPLTGGVQPGSCTWRYDGFPGASGLNYSSAFEYLDGGVNVLSPVEDCADAPCGRCYIRQSVHTVDGHVYYSPLYPFTVRQHLAIGAEFSWNRLDARVRMSWVHLWYLGVSALVADSVFEILACGPVQEKNTDSYVVDSYLRPGTWWTRDDADGYRNATGPQFWIWNNPALGGDDSVCVLPCSHPSNPYVIVHKWADAMPSSNSWFGYHVSE